MRRGLSPKRTLALALLAVLLLCGRLFAADLYQISTIEALVAGLYDGQATVGAVSRHGDFGLGCLAGLDGEMIVLDGVTYQVAATGKVRRVAAREMTPFAQVVFFKGTMDCGRLDAMTFDEAKKALTARLPDPDKFYAVRVDGLFSSLTVRSVAAQKSPWPPLAEALKGQSLFHLRDVQGAMVGFYSPKSAPGFSPPGWHFHFLTSDRTQGGHVLDARLGAAKARGDVVERMTVTFPDRPLPRHAAPALKAGTE